MIKIMIHFDGEYQDSITFSCDTIEEAKEIAKSECEKRGRDSEDCWSEIIE